MTANTTSQIQIGQFTKKGEYLGKGICPFPSMHCFSRGANKSFLVSIENVTAISKESFEAIETSNNKAKETFFFKTCKNISLD